MKRIYSLDILRVIASVMIVLHHYQQITDSYFGGRYNFRGFGVAVEFFFFLSGFLAVKYIGNKETDLVTFIKNKAMRLLPLVIISSVVYEILLSIYNEVCKTEWLLGNDISIWGIILNATGMQAGWVFENPQVNNPTWYVSVLLLCYVIFYFLLYISRKKDIPITYLFVGMVLLGVAINTYYIELPFLNEYSARGFYSFFSGLLLAKVLEKKEVNPKWTILALLITVGVLYGIIEHYEMLSNGFVYIMVFVFYPALIVLFISKPIRKIFNYKFIGVLGALTYDVYIWHVPMMLAMYIVFEWFSINLNLDYYKCLIGFTAGSFVVGGVSHFILDRPIQKVLKKKIILEKRTPHVLKRL